MSEKKAYFLHIPKSAGTTVQRIIGRQYWRSQIYTILPNPNDLNEGVRRFHQIEKEKYGRLRLIQGHYQYGIHHHWGADVDYFTFVREPVARVISTYHYILRQPNHRYYPLMSRPGMSLEKLLREEEIIPFDNLQSRLLSGVGFDAPYLSGDLSWVERAIEHIESDFRVVGLVDRFDESLILLQRAFGWRFPFYTKQNVGEKKGVPLEVQELIKERNQLDLQLYHLLEQRFEVEIEQLGDIFKKELSRFRFWNQLFDPWQQRSWRTGPIVKGKKSGA